MMQDNQRKQNLTVGDNATNFESLLDALLDRKILDILDGDSALKALDNSSETDQSSFNMPYLSGPVICKISKAYGLPVEYSWSGGNKSRHEYMRMLLEHCVKTNKISDLFSELFSKSKFADTLKANSNDQNDYQYSETIKRAVHYINLVLHLHNYKLVRNGRKYTFQSIRQSLPVTVPVHKQVDREYIVNLSRQAFENIESGDCEGAVTKARTLMEEFFWYAIENKEKISNLKEEKTPDSKGDIKKLFNRVKNLYGMQHSKGLDERIHRLLSGLNTIVDGITEMRNIGSDSHGLGARRIRVPDYYARLCVNSTLILSDFLLSVVQKNLDGTQAVNR